MHSQGSKITIDQTTVTNPPSPNATLANVGVVDNDVPIHLPIVMVLSLYLYFWHNGFPVSSNFTSLVHWPSTLLSSFILES